jgi:hypothetical protein
VTTTAAATAAAGQESGFLDKVYVFIKTAKARAADGLTWAEFGELLVALLRVAITALDEVAGMTGPQKKQVAIDAAAMLFDALADRAVPLAALPIWILVRPAIRSLVLALAAGAVEPLLQLVRSR